MEEILKVNELEINKLFEEWEIEAKELKKKNEDMKAYLTELRKLNKPCQEMVMLLLEEKRKVDPNADVTADERNEIFAKCNERIEEYIKNL